MKLTKEQLAQKFQENPELKFADLPEGSCEETFFNEVKKELEVSNEKGVIGYKKTPKAPKDDPWDGPAEVAAADTKGLKAMCAWFDSENPDVKSSYKLPHHKAEGDHAVVWRGVAAAMGALMGARGGVQIPDGDRQGVYNHLARHYKEFDEQAPEFKAYTEEELKDIFPDLIEGLGEEFTADFLKTKALEGKKIFKTFTATIKDLGDGMMEAIVNTGQEDRHGEVLDIKGLDVKEYLKNPILADAHDYSQPSLGRTHKLTKTRDGMLASKFEWAKDINPKAKLLYDLYKNKFQFAFSIGFMAHEMKGNTFTKSTMLEFSPVLIPADAGALLKAKNLGFDIGLISKELNQNPSLKGGDTHMKLTKKQIKDMLKGNPSLSFEEVKEMADESVFNEVKAELETETKAALEAAKKQQQTDEVLKKVDELTKQLSDLQENIKKLDTPITKNINISSQVIKNFESKPDKEKNALKFLYYVKGLQTKSFDQYIDIVGKSAMDTTDTSVVLPPAEFIAEVERLEEAVGIARQFATVRRSSTGKGVTYLMGDDDLEIFSTDEGSAKTSTKLSYANLLLEWRKFAGILPITDELTEDSAIDLWNDATQRFARAYSKKEDYLVFLNQSSAGKQKKGILYETGTKKVTLTDGYDSLTYDDLVDMIYGVPTPSADGGRFYMNREILGIVMKIKNLDGDPIWQKSMPDGAPATILGKPYSLVESLPGVSAEDENLPFMAFGNLRYVTLGERTDLVLKIFDTGSVGDPEENDQVTNQINLLTQDAQALRAVKRMNSVVRFPSAFSVAVTGSTLS